MASMLLLITLLLIKHAVADFFLQRAFMFKDKHVYGGLGGISHACIHGLLTFVAIVICFPSMWFFAVLMGKLDALVHYHVDYIKSNWNVRTQATPSETRYWYAFGLDQLAHHLTYIAIAIAVL